MEQITRIGMDTSKHIFQLYPDSLKIRKTTCAEVVLGFCGEG